LYWATAVKCHYSHESHDPWILRRIEVKNYYFLRAKRNVKSFLIFYVPNVMENICVFFSDGFLFVLFALFSSFNYIYTVRFFKCIYFKIKWKSLLVKTLAMSIFIKVQPFLSKTTINSNYNLNIKKMSVACIRINVYNIYLE